MAGIKHVLFPFDFSPQGAQTARFVAALARRLSARVTLYSVVPPAFDSAPPGIGRAGGDPAAWTHALQSLLNDALQDEMSGLAVDRVVDAGDPALRTVRFAETHAVDLIMMPTHGLGFFRHLLVGSVTAKVLHDAHGPVWTAVHAEAQATTALPGTVLCAVDGGPGTAALLRWAAGFCADCGATLTLLHVVTPITDIAWLEHERARQDQFRREALARIDAIRHNAGVEAPLRVAVGEIVPTVAEQARQDGADLVIIGRGSAAQPFGRLRTHALGIIQRSPCPVLSV